MTLEELKRLMDAAKAALDAKPEDAGLKTKFEEAKAAYDAKAAETADEDSDEDSDESGWDEKTKAYIAKLRSENAKHRNDKKDLKSKLTTTEAQKKAILKAAGIETEEEDPADQLQKSQEQTNQLAFRAAILESAVENGIGHDQLDYFQFLVAKEAEKLKDDEELSDDQMAEIVAKVKRAGAGGSANSSVGAKGQKKPGAQNPGGDEAVSLDQFCRMTVSEKGALYNKNPDLYSKLSSEAIRNNRLV